MTDDIALAGVLNAAARVLVYIYKAQHRIDKDTFDALRKLLLAHPEVSPDEFKATVREQWAILAVDERAAIEALPQLWRTRASGSARRALAWRSRCGNCKATCARPGKAAGSTAFTPRDRSQFLQAPEHAVQAGRALRHVQEPLTIVTARA